MKNGLLYSTEIVLKKRVSQLLRTHWRLLKILKTGNKSVWSNSFWYMKVYIFSKCIQYTIHWDKTQIFKKCPLDEIIDPKKMSFFFFLKLQLIPVLLLICDSYMSWSARFVSLKQCVGFFIFDSDSFLLKFKYIFQQNAWTLWLLNVIISFKIKVIEKPHTVLLPNVWFLSCSTKF